MTPRVYLKRGKEKPLWNHHPWVFSGAILRVENAQDGDTVEVLDAGGDWLARAAFNSRSQITCRVCTFDRAEVVDRAFFTRRLGRALELRRVIAAARAGDDIAPTAERLVNAESDGLPGLIVDRYGEFLVSQFLTLGVERFKAEIVDALRELCAPQGIYERSDVEVRKKEGLAERTGLLDGAEPPDRLSIVENGLHFWVDVKRGHKTGWYLDQRVNRERASSYLRGNVLNAFAYTGAFGVYAAVRHHARVWNLDTSAAALELARSNFELNGVAAHAEYLTADVFERLRVEKTAGRTFDAIVLDPPKFATSQSNLERATRGYKDLNRLALELLNPNGTLVTFSCSGLISPDLFQKIVFGAAVDAGRDAQIVDRLSQAPDHPVALTFPEGEYLKGLIVRAL